MTTDLQVLSWLQRKVAEPDTSGLLWQTGLWSLEEVLGYIKERQARFLRDTAIYLGIWEVPTTAYATDAELPQDIIQVHRVTWVRPDGTTASLFPSTQFSIDVSQQYWESQAEERPRIYFAQTDIPIGKIRIGPPSQTNGRLRIVGIAGGDADLDGSGHILTVPDDYVPFVRYGVLANMWGKAGRGQDMPRSRYCAGRFSQGIDIAKGRLEGNW